MENNDTSLSNKVIVQRLFVAFAIIGGCLLFSLYLFDILKISFLENPKFKIPVSIIILSAVVIYLVRQYGFHLKSEPIKNDWKVLILLSFIAETIGYWWIDTSVGYIVIIFGFILLIIGLSILYKQKRKKPSDVVRKN